MPQWKMLQHPILRVTCTLHLLLTRQQGSNHSSNCQMYKKLLKLPYYIKEITHYNGVLKNIEVNVL
jgi:hypothetical protein